MNIESTFIILFVIAMVVAIAVRHLRLPYTVGLVLAGLLLGWIHLFSAPPLNKTLLFSVFLPGLVFEAAFHINFEEFWRNRITITSLAVPGVIASTVLTAVALTPLANALTFFHGFSWRYALVFGALISATDPVAVVSLFRRLGIPKRLSMLIEGESLLNDGTSIVFFTLSLSILAGSTIVARNLAIQFLTVVGMGAAIGAIFGLIVSTVLRHVDDSMIEVSLTTIAAYGSFVVADQLQYSGVIATVAAGIVCGNYGARTGMSPASRAAAETFWEYVVFALNSVVFLLIGLEVPIHNLLVSWLPILTAYVIVTMSRVIVVQLVWRLVAFSRERFSWRWAAILTWGGLRGALPMVLALGIPPSFSFREQIITITFGVVILSILLHGLTMLPLLRHFGIAGIGGAREAYDLLRGELQAAFAAVEEIGQMEKFHSVSPDSLGALRKEYQQRIDDVREEIAKLPTEQLNLRDQEIEKTRGHLLLIEKNRIMEAYLRGDISSAVHDRLLADVDAKMLELESKSGDADSGTQQA